MAASYPGTIKTFSTKASGEAIASSHINDLQNEVVAVETQLVTSKLATLTTAPAANNVLTTDGSGNPTWADKAPDSDLLDGNDSAYFMPASYANGWIPVSATWTYASDTTITVPSGAASIYSVGDKFKLTANSVVLQGYIVTVANTLLTVVGDALTNHTFSAVSYSKAATPLGFPVWFAWTPASQTGWTDIPTGIFRFSVAGKTVHFLIDITAGTSNGTSAILALPVAPARRFDGTNGLAVNDGANLTVASRWFCETNRLIYFYTDMSAGTWTNSGTKRVRTSGFYEAA